MTSLRFVRRLTGYRGGIRYPNVVLMVGIALVLGVVWCEAVYAQDEDSPNAAITLEAPAQVETGAVISVTLRLSTPLTVGGWEAELRFDPAGAEFAGFYPAAPAGESSVGRLLLPQLPTGSAVGVYTCATAPCLERREVQAAGVETDPSVLGVVELLALTPGAVEVALSHVQVVDAAGNPLPVSLAADRVTVQVGSGSDRVVAPASAWPARTGVAVAADGGMGRRWTSTATAAWTSRMCRSSPHWRGRRTYRPSRNRPRLPSRTRAPHVSMCPSSRAKAQPRPRAQWGRRA